MAPSRSVSLRPTTGAPWVLSLLLIAGCGTTGGGGRGDDDGSGDVAVGGGDTGGADLAGGEDLPGGGGDSSGGGDTAWDSGTPDTPSPTDSEQEPDVDPDVGPGCTESSDCPGGHVCRDGSCREICSTEDPCTGPLPACDLEERLCVECAEPSDCRGGQTCRDQVCADICRTDEDCGVREFCDVSAGTCLEAECMEDRDCRGGEVCEAHECVPFIEPVCVPNMGDCDGSILIRCSEDGSGWETESDCAALGQDCLVGDFAAACVGPICEPGLVECTPVGIERCAPDGMSWTLVEACDDGEVCDLARGACVTEGAASLCQTCSGDAECGDADDDCVDVSLFGSGTCGLSCTSESDCPAGFRCAAGALGRPSQCKPDGGRCIGCLLDGCDGDSVCNGVSGECDPLVPTCGGCLDSEACGPGSACAFYGAGLVCLPLCSVTCPDGRACTRIGLDSVCAPSSGSCTTCGLRPSDCPEDRQLVDVPNCRCVSCLDAGDCDAGQVCGTNGRCLFSDGTRCSDSSSCFGDFCVGGFCVECRTDSDCPGEACVDGACSPDTCACDPGFHCDAGGECVPDDPTGDCTSDSECQARAGELGFGSPDRAACDPSVGCFILGLCDGTMFPGGTDDPFNAACATGLTCFPTDLVLSDNVCTGCTVGDDSTCRSGEVCRNLSGGFPFATTGCFSP